MRIFETKKSRMCIGWNEHWGQDDIGEVSRRQVTESCRHRRTLDFIKSKWGFCAEERHDLTYFVKASL